MAPQNDPSGELHSEFDELDIPIVAIELSRMRVVAATPRVFGPGRVSAGELIGRPVLDMVAPADRSRARLALKALAAGSIEFVRAHGRFAGPDPDQIYTHWVAAVEIGGERLAVAQIAAGMPKETSPLAKYLGSEPVDLAVGAVTRDWVVSAVSTGVEGLLGIAAEEFVGRVLLGAVAQGDVDNVLKAARKAKSDLSVGLSVRMRTAQRNWRQVRTVLGLLAESTERFFILAPEPAIRDIRSLKLEEHLRRIASEVQASGILEVAPNTPALTHLASRAQLTPRQWEVFTRLLRGERVSTIAEELFVSASTVRNHLSAIYDRFGVYSQAELMAMALGDRVTA